MTLAGIGIMQILVNTDHNIDGSDALTTRVQADVAAALDRFADRVTRVEVHLNDEASGKAGPNDKRCMIEARLRGHAPVTTTASAESLDLAVTAASEKLTHALDSLLGRLADRRADADASARE
jgi:ribosome-associated translation inhibitor RaiA